MTDDWKQDSRPKRGAWAPGDYFGRCFKCKQRFMGDKRAMWCADCAYAEPESAPTPPVTQDAVERVARAIAAHKRGVPPDSPEIADKWQSYCGQARAALAAAGAGKGGE